MELFLFFLSIFIYPDIRKFIIFFKINSIIVVLNHHLLSYFYIEGYLKTLFVSNNQLYYLLEVNSFQNIR